MPDKLRRRRLQKKKRPERRGCRALVVGWLDYFLLEAFLAAFLPAFFGAAFFAAFFGAAAFLVAFFLAAFFAFTGAAFEAAGALALDADAGAVSEPEDMPKKSPIRWESEREELVIDVPLNLNQK